MSSPSLHGWRPVRTEDGSWTFRHPEHGEACHSTSGGWLEARERYVLPCRLHEWPHERPLRLLDVGTGLGLNLAAALGELEDAGRALEAWTLECDSSVLRATLAWFADGRRTGAAERHHAAVRATLARVLEGEGNGAPLALGRRSVLHVSLGDGAETLPALPADLRFDAVFLDPFSPGREPGLWETGFLSAVARRMAPQARLSTYSAAFRVRLALARAGLRVGQGPRVGAKAEGTLASPGADLPPLDPRVEKRLRSDLTAVPGPILVHRLRERPTGID